MITALEVSDRTKALLKSLSNKEREELSDWYYPTSMEVFGLNSADLKSVISKIKKEIKTTAPELLTETALELAQLGNFECQQIAYGLLNRNFKEIQKLSYDKIMLLGAFMDNWVSTDSFSMQIAGPAWRLGVLSDKNIKDWAISKDRWWRRNALVATVGRNIKSQGGTGSPKETLMICSMLVSDHDDMVVKAMSWALRELSKHTKEPVKDFLNLHSDKLASRVKREVNKKLTTGRKSG